MSEQDSIERLVSLIAQANDQIAEIQTRITKMRGHGTAAAGRVVADVDSGGLLTGLTIDPRAMRLGSKALAQQIIAAVRDAYNDVSARAAEITDHLVTESTEDVGGSSAGSAPMARLEKGDFGQFREALKEARSRFEI